MKEKQEQKPEELEAALAKIRQAETQRRITGFEKGYQSLVATFGVERVTVLVMAPGNNPQWQAQDKLLPDDVWKQLQAQEKNTDASD